MISHSVSPSISRLSPGKLARYMDNFNCRYGFYTTYNKTWFLCREDSYHFRASKAVPFTNVATPDTVSLRECCLYIGLMASDNQASFWAESYGPELVRHLPLTDYDHS